MDIMEIIRKIVEIFLIPVLGVLATYVVQLIRAKISAIKIQSNNETVAKYLDMLDKIIVECVQATNQTYVGTMKDQDIFDIEAHKKAFSQTYNAVSELLTEEMINVLSGTVDDIEVYIQQKIEATVLQIK